MTISKKQLTSTKKHRIVVKIPLRSNCQLSDTRRIVYKQLKIMQAKKEQDNKLKREYDKFMFEYLQRDEMQEIPDDQLYAKGVYYIPHHMILREASLTTKLRVVLDANCRSSTGSS
jgi:hypothetical protein